MANTPPDFPSRVDYLLFSVPLIFIAGVGSTWISTAPLKLTILVSSVVALVLIIGEILGPWSGQ